MALGSSDERDLLLPLAEGIHEQPHWQTFLKRLLARTRASRAALVIRFAPATGLKPLVRLASSNPALPAPDLFQFAVLDLIPFVTQRRDRVYALEEMLNYDDAERRGAQRKLLAEAEVADARFIRAVSRSDHDCLLVLLHERLEFGAGDSALLSALAPHLAVAAETLATLHALRLRLALADDALRLLGIGQAAFDRDGHAIAADPLFSQALDVTDGERLHLPGRAAQVFAESCADLDGRPASQRRVVGGGESSETAVLVRPAPETADGLASNGIAIGAIRLPQRRAPSGQAQMIARLHGLSDREAALAEAISRGASIIEAGAALRLSPETARNYSKRIYAKTGASGQADLVRLLLTGLAPLA